MNNIHPIRVMPDSILYAVDKSEFPRNLLPCMFNFIKRYSNRLFQFSSNVFFIESKLVLSKSESNALCAAWISLVKIPFLFEES
jgi:hypothetical protein